MSREEVPHALPKSQEQAGQGYVPAQSGHEGSGRGGGHRQERAQSHWELIKCFWAPLKSTPLQEDAISHHGARLGTW